MRDNANRPHRGVTLCAEMDSVVLVYGKYGSGSYWNYGHYGRVSYGSYGSYGLSYV